MISSQIFEIKTDKDFEQLSLEVFNYQFENNKVYRSFCDLLYRHPSDVKSIEQIPFLPIQFFKSHEVVSGNRNPQIYFTSSGTTGSNTSKHFVHDLRLYEESFQKCFELFYGDIKDYVVLALLPSYLEREGSSLIYMVDRMIQDSGRPESGFYLDQHKTLQTQLETLDAQGQKILLIGVSFALLDLLEGHHFNLRNTVVMETGGMKGRRKEMVREELHQKLKKGFGVQQIHSEYGMTELLSQAYSRGNGIFDPPPWMRAIIRDPEDALTIFPPGRSGGINIVDLANINSCSFLATQDLGRVWPNHQFEVLGRFDHADIRGCNLLVL